MKRRQLLLRLSVASGVPVIFAGCSSEEIARLERASGPPGTGFQFIGIAKVIVLATHPATQQQLVVAEQRVQKAVAKLKIGDSAGHARPQKPATGPSVAESKANPPYDRAAAAAGKPLIDIPADTTVIAVDTVPDERSKGSHSVMLWNVKTKKFVGNNVYDVSSPPKQGRVALWEGTRATYIGNPDTLLR